MRYACLCVCTVLLLLSAGCDVKPAAPPSTVPRLLVTLPAAYCNTPDGCTLSPGGDIILSMPNFNNGKLIADGKLEAPQPALMVKIDARNTVSKWYEFTEADLHPDTGIVGPMGCVFGPDGHLYVADNQLFTDPGHKSRLLRITVENGAPVRCEPVVEGFIVSNAVIWRGDTVYVSETILAAPGAAEPGAPPPKLMSGVYAFKLDAFKDGPVRLAPWSPEKADPHLIATFESSGSIGFGADGLTFDGEGNLYCSIFEDGTIYKITFNADGSVKETRKFAESPKMPSADGIFWRRADNKIYVADMLMNGVHAVDMQGNVTTLHTNGDTDGADGMLDQPCEVIVRGNELIIVNMDMPFPSDRLVNTQIDEPYTLSVITLP